MKQCPRCLKHVDIEGAHTCNPTEFARKLEEANREMAIRNELYEPVGHKIIIKDLTPAADVESRLSQALVCMGWAQPGTVTSLQAFARECLNVCWEGGDLDGGQIQEMGVKHGLLAPTTMNAPCNNGDPDMPCQCAEFNDAKDFESGVTCYRYTGFMAAPKSSPAYVPRIVTGRCSPNCHAKGSDEPGECMNSVCPLLFAKDKP